MTSGWFEQTYGWRERIPRVLRERAQSEVLGATLLTGIMVILISMAGLFLFADFGGDDEQLLANIEGDVTAADITLTHDGGDTFDSEEIEVVVSGDNERDLNLSSDFDPVDGGDGQFAPGDTWRYNTSDDLLLGDGRMLVIHEPTNTVLFDDGYSVQVAPGGIELRVESFNHSDKQSDSADVYGEGDQSDPNDDGVPWEYDAFVDFNDDGQAVKNPSELNITFDPADPDSLRHNLTGHTLEAFEPTSSPKNVTVTASVDGFEPEDEVFVDVYPVASLSLTINKVGTASNVNSNAIGATGAGSPSLQPSAGTAELSTLQNVVELPKNSTLAVKFTAWNNQSSPAIDETVELTSPGISDSDSKSFSRVDPGESRSGTLNLNLTGFKGKTSVKLTVGGETKTRTLKVVEGTFEATDLVPNAKQQQTFRFSLSNKLLAGESVTITLPSPPSDSVLGYGGSPKVEDGEGGSVTETTDDNSEVKFTYTAGGVIPAQTPIEIRVPQVTVGSADEHVGQYKYKLERLSNGFSRSAKASISRNAGDAGLDVDATDLSGTSKQKLTLTFEPTFSPETIGQDEAVAIDLTDGLDALDLSNVNVEQPDNAGIKNEDADEDPDSGSHLTLALGSSYSGGPVEVNLTSVKPEVEGEFEVGFSRGANDTVSDTVEVEAQKPSAFESVSLTDIVPNANSQQQTLSLTLNSSLSSSELPGGETISFNIDGHRPEGDGKIYYGNAEAEVITNNGGDDAEINGNDALGQGVGSFSLPDTDNINPGQTFKIRLSSVKPDNLDEQTGPYDVTVSAADRLTATKTTFDVSRDGQLADASLASFSIEDISGTNKQTQNITFEPDGEFDSEELVAIELNDAYINGSVASNGFNLVSGQGQILNSNTGGDPVFVTYRAPQGGSSEEVTIELQANPDSDAIGEGSYNVGVNRGTAGTAGGTFGVFQPAQFDVSLTDAIQGTHYGSEDNGLSVTAEVENTASYTDTQTISLDVAGSTDETDLTLDGGESTTVTLSASSISAGDYTANVSSETAYDLGDATVLENQPELVGSLEQKEGDVGDTVAVDLNVTSFEGSGDEIGSYQVVLSFDPSVLSFQSVQAGDWGNPSFVNTVSGAVSAASFDVGGAQTPSEPALTFEFKITGPGTSGIEFNSSAEGVPGSNEINDENSKLYESLLLNGSLGTGAATLGAQYAAAPGVRVR